MTWLRSQLAKAFSLDIPIWVATITAQFAVVVGPRKLKAPGQQKALVATNARQEQSFSFVTLNSLALFLAVSWLQHPTLAAQETTAQQTLERGREVYKTEGARAALPIFQQALERFRQSKDRRGEGVTLGLMGNCYKRFGEHTKALDLLNQALSLKRAAGDRGEEARTLSHLGLLFWDMSQYSKAIDQLERSVSMARELGDRTLEAASLNNLGLVFDELGNYRQSLLHYERALELQRASREEADESFTLGNIGGIHLLLGRFREALKFYQQSLAISERLGLKPSASQDLGNLGLCYIGLGQLEESIRSFDRALALAQLAGLAKEEADWHKGKGGALFRLGKYDLAMEAYRRALQVYERSGLRRERVEALLDVGNLHVQMGDLVSAVRQFQQASRLAGRIEHPRGATAGMIALGDVELRRKRFAEAEGLYRRALERARQANDDGHQIVSLLQLAMALRDQQKLDEAMSQARVGLDRARQIGAPALEAQALLVAGDIQRLRGQHAEALELYQAGETAVGTSGDVELLWRLAFGKGQLLEGLDRTEEALAAFQRAAATVETVRSQLRIERFRAGYLEDKTDVYVSLVRLLLKLGRVSEAFTVAERLRAQSAISLFAQTHSLSTDKVGAELKERIRSLQESLERERTKTAVERRSLAVEQLSGELAAAEREYQNLLSDRQSLGSLDTSGLAARVPGLSELQAVLPEDVAVLEYVILDNQIALFLLTRDDLRVKTTEETPASLSSRVELLRDLLLQQGKSSWQKPAEGLRRILISPIEDAGWLAGRRRLYLVPHGVLHHVPYAALLRKGRFLIQDYELALLPSASALMTGNGDAPESKPLLALAPERSRLLYAGEEVRQLARLYAASARVYAGPTATEGAFKKFAASHGLLHLATHGTFNRWNPLLSAVELEKDHQEDGRLEVHEILAMRLKARLVTLSACQTAMASGFFSEIPAGDAFVGLTQAFLTAGSRTVLSTLWEVNDRSTLSLMSQFYENLKSRGACQALALAQRKLLAQKGSQAHPYFWAPFVLFGFSE